MASLHTDRSNTDPSFFGLSPWFCNFTQLSTWEAANEKNLALVHSPYLEYGIYCALKCAQVASFVSGCIAHPIYRFHLHRKLTPETTTNNSYKVIRNICRKMQARCLLFGVAATPLVTAASVYLHGYSTTELREVCYQIRRSELTYDRTTAAFAFWGWYWKRFSGAVDGVNAAFLYTVVHYTFIRDGTNTLLKDRIKYDDIQCYETSEEGYNSSTRLTSFLYNFLPSSTATQSATPSSDESTEEKISEK